MKKTVLFAAALFTVAAASAQTGEITSAKGENWLSQDGDWGLTLSAQPLVNYVGNLFNNGTNSDSTVLFNSLWGDGSTFNGSPAGTTGIVIGGKKLVDANTAYRGRIRIGFGSQKQTEQVAAIPQPTPPPTPATQVDNVTKDSYMGIYLGGGLEKRVGSTRVVGIYGGEIGIALGNQKRTFEYGNALSAQNSGSRPTESKFGSSFGLALFGFAGVEWFAAPKLSIGGEMSWGVGLSSRGLASTTSESFDTTANAIVSQTVEGNDVPTPEGGDPADKTSNFSIDTGISGAQISLNFYFQ